jgi:hypothetical protein
MANRFAFAIFRLASVFRPTRLSRKAAAVSWKREVYNFVHGGYGGNRVHTEKQRNGDAQSDSCGRRLAKPAGTLREEAARNHKP